MSVDMLDLDVLARELADMETDMVCGICGEPVELDPSGLVSHEDEDEAAETDEGPHSASLADDFDLESYVALKEFLEENEDQWSVIVRESDFQEWVEIEADSLMDIPDSLSCYIDYEKMADDWRMDYTSLSWDGVDYLAR